MVVTNICDPLEKKCSNKTFFRFELSKNIAFAPYSPIRLGVAKDTVSEAKLCFIAVEKFILWIIETKVFHFRISKYQFAVAKNKKSNSKYPETLTWSAIVSLNLENFSDEL